MLATLNKRGGNHNSCQDSILVLENENFIQGGIFDGCSSGINSEWASKTITYILEFDLKKYKPFKIVNDYIIYSLITKLRGFKNHTLGLKNENFLSTMLLFYYDKKSKILHIRNFGDGIYYINGIEYIIEQNNLVDYIGDSLDLNMSEQIKYVNNHPIIIYKNVENFQICSDGIKAIIQNQFIDPKHQPDILLKEPTSPNYLERMHNILLKNKFEFKDDISIISYFNNNINENT